MSIVDLHCDTISEIRKSGDSLLHNSGHFDLERAVKASVCLQVFALFVSPREGNNSLRQVLKQADYFHQQIEANKELTYLVSEYKDIINPKNANKIGCMLHLEGADVLGSDPEVLRLLYRLGLRSVGLTWNHRNLLADGVGEGENGAGLSKQGRFMIKEFNHLNIILDLAHVGPRSFNEAMEVYEGPVMVSHANARGRYDHPRNLSDEQLRLLAGKDGIIGVTMVTDFVKQGQASVDDLLDHIEYISDLIGVHYVALGSDFDGASNLVVPGVESYENWDYLLSKRGFSESERTMVLQKNAFRLFENILD